MLAHHSQLAQQSVIRENEKHKCKEKINWRIQMIKKSTLLSVFIMLIYFTMCMQNVNYAYSTVTVKGNCPHHEGATNTTIYENVDDETYHGVIQYCDYNGYSNHGTGHETHDFGGWTDSNATYHKKRCKSMKSR